MGSSITVTGSQLLQVTHGRAAQSEFRGVQYNNAAAAAARVPVLLPRSFDVRTFPAPLSRKTGSENHRRTAARTSPPLFRFNPQQRPDRQESSPMIWSPASEASVVARRANAVRAAEQCASPAARQGLSGATPLFCNRGTGRPS